MGPLATKLYSPIQNIELNFVMCEQSFTSIGQKTILNISDWNLPFSVPRIR